jgi:protease-4
LYWSGDQALKLGLIDGLGSTGSVARDVIGEENIVDYTVKPNFLEMLGLKMGAKFDKALGTIAGLPQGAAQPTLQ